MTEDRRTFFKVPVHNFAKLEAEIERLSRRSQKAGGWAIELTRFGTFEDKDTGARAYEVFLDAPDVRLDGYEFIARLDHSQETGNIIRMMPNTGLEELPSIYRTAAPNCDHCQINRIRRDTFVLRQIDDGSLVQLGTNCMKEFFKTDPRAIMKLAELVAYAREAATAAEKDDFVKKGKVTLRDLRFIMLNDFLLHCAAAMRVQRAAFNGVGNGFVSGKTPKSTRNVALRSYVAKMEYDRLTDSGLLPYADEALIEVTADDEATVAQARQWIDILIERRDTDKPLDQFEHNMLVIGEAVVIEARAIGYAAAIVGCFERGLRKYAPKPAYIREPAPAPKPINVGDMSGIMKLFDTAKAQWPKITISFEDTGEIVISRAGPSSQYPGSINVATPGGYDVGTWFGRIHRDGRWEPTRSKTTVIPKGLEAALLAFATDPAGVAAAYGHRSGNCCFCHKKLTDQISAHVGYGKTCAGNYKLPYPTPKQFRAETAIAMAA